MVEDPITGIQNTLITNHATAAPEYTSSGGRLSPIQVAQLRTLKPGDKVFVDDIRASGPDGTMRTLGSLLFTIR